MTVKHISEIIGDFGKWQLNIAAFYFTIYILSPFNNLGITFHAPAEVDYRCVQYNQFVNHSQIAYSTSLHNSSINPDRCLKHEFCGKWTYNETFGRTIVSEFDLVCDKSWLSSLSQSFYQIGYVVNGLLLGYLSDRFGRRPVLWLSLAIEICGGLSLTLSQSMIQYIISRFFLGLGDSGRGVCLSILILETVGPKYRSDIATSVSFGWILGYISLPGFAYWLKEFRYLQAIPTAAAVLLLMTWLWTIPESPRWQLSNNRLESGRKGIMRAAKMNNKIISEVELNEKLSQIKSHSEINDNIQKEQKHLTIIDLMSQRDLRRFTLIFWFSFAVNAFIYHGISLNIEQIGGNLYINFAIAGLVEIPSLLLNIFGLKYIGRKYFTVGTMLLASVSYVSIVLMSVYKDSIGSYFQILKLVFAMIGKLFIFSSFNAIYIHSGEIFPTVLRHTGIGSCSIAARIGSILAPFVKELSQVVNFGFSMLVFGLLALMATILTLFLPETKGRDIPDNIQDVQNIKNLSETNESTKQN